MKKIALVTLFAVSLVSSSFAFAASKASSAAYKSAGCGLGSQLIQDDGIIQIFAATLNGTSGNQTFAITSGTSNCTGSGGYAKADAAQEMYVSSNIDAISQEMAQGSGEHLTALASLFGCEKNANGSFNSALRKNYRTIVGGEATTEHLIQGVKATVASDPALNTVCSNG